MPSVRVKRSQYAHIGDDIYLEETHGRPRSRSVNQPYDQEAGSSATRPPHVRHRSHTISGLGGYSNPAPRRTTSKISEHIMATSRTPRLESAQLSNDPQSSRAARSRSGTQSGLSPPPVDPPDVISLQGSNENIIYLGDANRIGRIGSSFTNEEHDDAEHHHDDIVEHLEVIGTLLLALALLLYP